MPPDRSPIVLSAYPGFTLPALDGAAGPDGAVVTGTTEQVTVRTWWDTDDLRVVRWGHALSCDAARGALTGTWRLSLHTHDGAAAEENGPTGAPPPRLAAALRGLTRGAPLAPVRRVEVRRRTRTVQAGDGRRAVTVDDDVVSVLDGRRVASRFRQVTIRGNGPAKVRAKVEELVRAAGAVDGSAPPLVLAALGAAALAPPDVVAPSVDPDGPAGEAAHAALATGVARLLRHEPGVRLGLDPEDLHQARVAVRRLRSDLDTFGPLFDEEWARSTRAQLADVGRALGHARDADVLAGRLGDRARGLAVEERTGAGLLLARLERDRDTARAGLATVLDAPAYLDLLDRLVAAAAAPPFASSDEPARPARDVVPDLVATSWDRLADTVDALSDDPPDDDLHAIRRRAKRARYAAEAAVPVHGEEALGLAARLAALQEVLGGLQDAVVAEAWLRNVAAEDPASAFAAGRLFEQEQRLAETARRRWRKAWRAAARPKHRAWMR